jgi:hypothetical protein
MRELHTSELDLVSGCGFWSDLGHAVGRLHRQFQEDMAKLDDGSPEVEQPERIDP